ncbi:hypothetical protein [Kurthia sibirica]|uniref:hypothetical protein n=1 Tax=Kurthia sibirica TaxID=202750 RepID=UPI0035E7E5C8
MMNVDPNGKIAWWIASALIGGAVNALPMLGSYFYKHRSVKGFNWWRFGFAFVTGAATSVLGARLFNYLLKVEPSKIYRFIAMASYAPKAYILNTLSKGKYPTLRGVVQAYTTSSIVKELTRLKKK